MDWRGTASVKTKFQPYLADTAANLTLPASQFGALGDIGPDDHSSSVGTGE